MRSVLYSLLIQHSSLITLHYRALIATDFLEKEALEFAEAEYQSDTAAYGPMNQQAFFDVVLELVDTWAQSAGQFFRSSFAWALFDR